MNESAIGVGEARSAVGASQEIAPPIASVIIPAHNEEATIGRLLAALTETPIGSLEIVVVCNACSDDTAAIAAEFDGVVVRTIAEPSKASALALGDAIAKTYPRLYVDADVEIDSASILRLADAVQVHGTLAAAPERNIPRDHVSRLVRWYYDVWEQLPSVREGLFGRGVIALSREGHACVRALPRVMADDLAFSEAFGPAERRIVPGTSVVVHPPRTSRDLLRRRVRAHTGNAQADVVGTRDPQTKTSWRQLLAISRSHWRMAVRMPAFLGVTAVARRRAARRIARGDFHTWLRDDSSRQIATERRTAKALPTDGLVVWQAGVSWDAVAGTDRQMVTRLGALCDLDILWVDPPVPIQRHTVGQGPDRRRPTSIAPHVLRVTPLAPPFPHRPGVDVLTAALLRRFLRRTVRGLGRSVGTVVGTSPHPRLTIFPGATRIYYATDDFVAGARLMGKDPERFRRLETARLREADVRVAISADVADRWRIDDAGTTTIVPNGCDTVRYADVDLAAWPTDLQLPGPVVGLIGQLSARVDLSLLEAIADDGMSLMLVGPRNPQFETRRVNALLARPNVQWLGRKPVEELPSYLRAIDVGITPYLLDQFNHASFPLKTLEYLAAGRPVVSTPLRSVESLNTALIATAGDSGSFVREVRAAMSRPGDPGVRRAYARAHDWSERALNFASAAGWRSNRVEDARTAA